MPLEDIEAKILLSPILLLVTKTPKWRQENFTLFTVSLNILSANWSIVQGFWPNLAKNEK